MQFDRRAAGEVVAPAGGQRVEVVTGKGGPLPRGEVRVLDRQGGQARLPARELRSVELGEVAGHDLDGASVGDDVVHDQREHVVVVTELHGDRSDERAGSEMERLGRFGAHDAGCRSFGLGLAGDGRDADAERERRTDHLVGHAVLGLERRAQRFMTGDERVDRPPERRHVHRSAEPKCDDHRVGRVAR